MLNWNNLFPNTIFPSCLLHKVTVNILNENELAIRHLSSLANFFLPVAQFNQETSHAIKIATKIIATPKIVEFGTHFLFEAPILICHAYKNTKLFK